MSEKNNEKIYSISWRVIQAGQLRSYADSIYEYEIESSLWELEIERFCTSFLKPSNHKCKGKSGEKFNGSSSFPYGLESYYSFDKIDENKYHYIVCKPYTG